MKSAYASAPSRTIWGELPPVHILRSRDRTRCGAVVDRTTWNVEDARHFRWHPCKKCLALGS